MPDVGVSKTFLHLCSVNSLLTIKVIIVIVPHEKAFLKVKSSLFPQARKNIAESLRRLIDQPLHEKDRIDLKIGRVLQFRSLPFGFGILINFVIQIRFLGWGPELDFLGGSLESFFHGDDESPTLSH